MKKIILNNQKKLSIFLLNKLFFIIYLKRNLIIFTLLNFCDLMTHYEYIVLK